MCICIIGNKRNVETLRETNKCMYVYSVGKRACVEARKNKIEILKTDVIMNVTTIKLDSCNKDYYIKWIWIVLK